MYNPTVFGQRLRAWRTKRGYTQRALQAAARVPFESISRLENGQQQPSWETAIRLAEALRISLDEFMIDTPP